MRSNLIQLSSPPELECLRVILEHGLEKGLPDVVLSASKAVLLGLTHWSDARVR